MATFQAEAVIVTFDGSCLIVVTGWGVLSCIQFMFIIGVCGIGLLGMVTATVCAGIGALGTVTNLTGLDGVFS